MTHTHKEPVKPGNILLIRMHEDTGGCPDMLFLLTGVFRRSFRKAEWTVH